jgi:hypothetical protein
LAELVVKCQRAGLTDDGIQLLVQTATGPITSLLERVHGIAEMGGNINITRKIDGADFRIELKASSSKVFVPLLTRLRKLVMGSK